MKDDIINAGANYEDKEVGMMKEYLLQLIIRIWDHGCEPL